MRYDTTLRFLGVLSACAAIAACATAPSTQPSPLLPEFRLVKELSPEFASSAEGWFTETVLTKDGREYKGQESGLVYKCAGRPQEYFEFRDNPDGGPPEVVSRDKPSYFRQFEAETFPKEMLKAFSDRSTASDEDAIRNLLRLEPGSWPPFGLVVYVAFEDGWLVAYDLGEFGGALIWLPKEGDSYIVSDKNTRDLLQVGDVVYAAQGLDHLGLYEGRIQTVGRGMRVLPNQNARSKDESDLDDLMVTFEERWGEEPQSYPAASSVSKIAYRDGTLVGLTAFGLVFAGTDGVVRYNHPTSHDRRKVVQRPGALHIDKRGRVYVGGPDMIGVYSGLPGNLTPDLYARHDCNIDYGDAAQERG